jgi:hypothetical protein
VSFGVWVDGWVDGNGYIVRDGEGRAKMGRPGRSPLRKRCGEVELGDRRNGWDWGMGFGGRMGETNRLSHWGGG